MDQHREIDITSNPNYAKPFYQFDLVGQVKMGPFFVGCRCCRGLFRPTWWSHFVWQKWRYEQWSCHIWPKWSPFSTSIFGVASAFYATVTVEKLNSTRSNFSSDKKSSEADFLVLSQSPSKHFGSFDFFVLKVFFNSCWMHLFSFNDRSSDESTIVS